MGGEPWQPITDDRLVGAMLHQLNVTPLWPIPDDLLDPTPWLTLNGVTVYGPDWEPINPLDPEPAYRGPTMPAGVLYTGPQFTRTDPNAWQLQAWQRLLVETALHATRWTGRFVIPPRQHGRVQIGGKAPTWQTEVAQSIAEHAAGRDRRSKWACRFGAATLTDAEAYVWQIVTLDAGHRLM